MNLSGIQQLFEAVRQAGISATSRVRQFDRRVWHSFSRDHPGGLRAQRRSLPMAPRKRSENSCWPILVAAVSLTASESGSQPFVFDQGNRTRLPPDFFPSIIREPLKGQTAVLPVAEDVRHWFASPRAAVNFLFHAGALDLINLVRAVRLTCPGYRLRWER